MSTKASLRQVSASYTPRAELGSEAPPPRPLPLATSGRPGQRQGSGERVLGRAQGQAQPSFVVQRNEGELILDYPQPLAPVTAIRSTLITSSLSSLRDRGLFERYDALQTSPHRHKILNVVAG
ncbi:MAG TPA: hypothetical protein VNN80_14625, partial [Polyangiaceae bacterium]|nr:hypothetical protein [Polyangiaceae bacterium]